MHESHSNNPYIIGVDVSKDKLDIYNLNESKFFSIPNNKGSIKKLIAEKKKNNANSLFVMENTGGYEKLLINLLVESACQFHVAHPNRIHYFAKQKGQFAKTDKIDAKIIAQYALQEKVEPTKPASKQASLLKELSTRRNQLITNLTNEKLRFKQHLSALVKRSLKRSIKCIQTEIDLLDKHIDKIVTEDDELKEKSTRLKTFKGIGPKTAAALICLLPELGNVNRAQIACLCGLAPKNKDSGQKVGRRMISGGRFYVRKALYMVAVGAMTHNPKMKAYYQKLISKGKPSKVALTAIMRKIIITLNAMLRDGRDWQAV